MANPNGNPQNLAPFRPGQSGNPGGKPLRVRNRLSGAFLSELAEDFDQHGRDAIVACREQSPSRYLAIVASLLPKELKLEQDRPLSDCSDEELMAVIDWLHSYVQELVGSNEVNGNSSVEAVGAVNGAKDE